MIELFGEPQVHPQNFNDKYGRFAKNCFFVDKSRVEKIIAIKKYRDIRTIGVPGGEKFTGQEEEIILDLNNFDQETYNVFASYHLLGMEPDFR